MKLRIGILGTRGIPNNYGGFEKVAEKLSAGLVAKGHAVFVYNTSNHPFQGKNWQGVNIIHCYDPSTWMGTAGQSQVQSRGIRAPAPGPRTRCASRP